MAWEAVPYEPAMREEWDELVRRSRCPYFLFERGYVEYHADRFEDASFVLERDGRAAALFPASRHDGRVVSHGGLTFGGLLSCADLTAARAVDAVECLLGALRAGGAPELVYKPAPYIYQSVPAQEDLYALALRGARLAGRDVSAAVAPAEPVGYSSERKRAVKRGLREELEILRSDDFEAFMALEREVLLTRHGAEPVHSPEEIRLLAERFPDGIHLHVAHASDGELVAGVLVYETPSVARCQYIGASDRGRELRAQDVLFHRLLTDVYAGKPWFDFGTSMRPEDGTLNTGLIRNKEGFGARAVLYDRYVLELS